MRAKSQRIDPAKIEAYRSTFIRHVHLLVVRAHCRLDHSSLQTLHEPAITGLICQQIESMLDDPASPRWVDDYEIHDDPPVHDKQRQGKHRRRVDLKLASRRFRPRCRFCFEAKCLNKSAGVADYLGPDGLGQFTSGSYAARDPQAGLLAYIQTDDCQSWNSKIGKQLTARKHCIAKDGHWTQVTIAAEITNCYRTMHSRTIAQNIEIFHTSLQCACSD